MFPERHTTLFRLHPRPQPQVRRHRPRGTYTFNFEQIPAQPLTPNPAMVRFAAGTEIAATSDGCTGVYLNTDGSSTWTSVQIVAVNVDSAPAMVRTPSGTAIAVMVGKIPSPAAR